MGAGKQSACAAQGVQFTAINVDLDQIHMPDAAVSDRIVEGLLRYGPR